MLRYRKTKSSGTAAWPPRNARARLANEWGQFAPAVQNECTQLSSMKGFQSYVELLTCLQMTQDAKKLPTQQ